MPSWSPPISSCPATPPPGLTGAVSLRNCRLSGLLLEAVADEQKLVAKRAHGASVPVTGGLYGVCRHPNYLGEIVFHLGVRLAHALTCRIWAPDHPDMIWRVQCTTILASGIHRSWGGQAS